ncbi:hypothetical protein VNO80_03054 [Phaseolus coccineus]|uniref:Uncharacterized protein n=1 Tax=Phaseolus coccineus TaxID=3886 RepID=A0AAN9NQS3_PHACN
MDYASLYLWARDDLLEETFIYTIGLKLRELRESQALKLKAPESIVGDVATSKGTNPNQLAILSKVATVGSGKVAATSKVAPSGILLDSDDDEQTSSDCSFQRKISRAALAQPIQPSVASQSDGHRLEKVIVEQSNTEGSNKKVRTVGKYKGWEVNQLCRGVEGYLDKVAALVSLMSFKTQESSGEKSKKTKRSKIWNKRELKHQSDELALASENELKTIEDLAAKERT